MNRLRQGEAAYLSNPEIHWREVRRVSSVHTRFRERLHGREDLAKDELRIGNRSARLYYLRNLVDRMQTREWLLLQAQAELRLSQDRDCRHFFGGKKDEDPDLLVAHVLRAGAVLFWEENHAVCVEAVSMGSKSAPSASQNENAVYSPSVAFTDSISTNIGLLQSLLISQQLICHEQSIGEQFSRRVALLYVADRADPQLVQAVWRDLTQDPERPIFHLVDLYKRFRRKWWNPFPEIYSTELPSETYRMLLQGRVVMLLDNHPFALVAPGSFYDALEVGDDLNNQLIVAVFFRVLRVAGLITALLAPALYVSLVAVHPEILRIQLALSIAQSREGVPYPAFVEIAFMMILLELIIEASVRLPKNIGPTITMVGGIILGQAVVQAQLVSNLLIIVLSAMAISNFALVGLQNMTAIRIFKYVFLLFSSIYGFLGIGFGFIWLSIYLSGMKLFGVPYLKRWKIRR